MSLNPADFPLKSMESRMAMRARLQQRGDGVEVVVFMTGMPGLGQEPPAVRPPDTVSHYQAPDGSIVEVIRREFAPGRFTSFVNQTWNDGNMYTGDAPLTSLVDLGWYRRL
jgi:hypothetical protein